MERNKDAWLVALDALIQKKHMLSHPFYQAWTAGSLSLETLQTYAKEYYHHVKAFPTYLSAIHCRSDDQQVRKFLLENLIDEEAGSPNHPDLWKTFALSLGVTEDALASHVPAPATKALIEHFRTTCSTGDLALGVASLYCYESQIPAICPTKIDGLKKWYGMTDPEGYRYFTVHEEADVEHSRVEKEMLAKMVSPDQEKAVLETSQKTLDCLYDFLSSFQSGTISCEMEMTA